MGEMKNGASSASGQLQKSSSASEDFGDGFLTSWKSANLDKDEINFDMEDVPKKGKRTFNFDKMDDFELGGNFDKISSFKVDMFDLDYSSPVKKPEKTNEMSCKETGKNVAKQQKFSFTFDFNELDRFSLNSDLLKGKKMSKGIDGRDHSSKYSGDQDSRCNSIKSTDAFSKVRADSVVTSRPRDLIHPSTANGSHPSTSNQEQTDITPDVGSLAQKAVSSADQMKIGTDTLGCSRKHSDGACSKELTANNLLGDVPPSFPIRLSSCDVLPLLSKEQENGIRSVGSSQSRNSSPVNSCNSKWGRTEDKKEEGDESNRGSRTIIESTIHQNVAHKISDANPKGNHVHGSNITGDKKDHSLMILPSASQRHLTSGKPLGLEEKSASALQSKFLEKPGDDASQFAALFNQKQHHTIPHEKAEDMHVCHFSEQRGPHPNGHSENEKGGTSKLLDGSVTETKSKINIIGKEKHRALDASCSQLQSTAPNYSARLSNSLRQSISNSSTKSSTRDLVSSNLPKKSSHSISLEKLDMSLEHDKRSESSNLTVSRLTKLNIGTPKTKLQKETSSVKQSKGNNVLLPNMLTKVTNRAYKDDKALASPLLKRKKLEEPKEESVTLYPSKRVTNVSNERRSLEASPEININLRPSPRSCHIDAIDDHTTSPNGALTVGSMINFDVPMLVENDGNVEKAEACLQELDDMCNMLKKRHDEAKELLVRVMVNNNTLLMLNHPMLDEKINAIQRSAARLKSKEFWNSS